MKRLFGDRLGGCFTLWKHWIVANRRSERAVSYEKVRSFQGKNSKNEPAKQNNLESGMLLVGPEAAVSFSIGWSTASTRTMADATDRAGG